MSTKAYNEMLFENVDSTGQVKLGIFGNNSDDEECTQFAVFKNTSELDSLLTKELYDTNSSKFHSLKNLAKFFPVRRDATSIISFYIS